MAKIGKSINGVVPVTVNFFLQDSEFQKLEAFREHKEKWFREHSYLPFPDVEEYSLDSAVLYIVREILSGRARYIDLDYNFSD